jgi:NADPH-dependent 2,4-dienoyl-CoA reductase/sulfur reductase-like enzyme
MGRQLLTDPEIVAKLRRGDRASIRPCINCYVCVEQNFFDDPPRCAVNPALCNERAADMAPASPPRHVVVVGGGPAGMETARIAGERGHRVTLVEAGRELGGTAWISQLTTPANGPFVEWLAAELERLGVVVRLRERATVASIRSLSPDVVVVATGATRGLPDVPGAQLPHVQTGDALRALIAGDPSADQPRWLRLVLLTGRALRITSDVGRIRSLSRRWMPVRRRVAIIGGGLVGLELAEFLATRRRDVTVLERGSAIGLPMASPRRWTAVRRAEEHGVTLVRDAEVTKITTTDVAYRVGGAEARVRADSVIVASEVEPGARLAASLAELAVEVHVVGDAADVGYIEGAVHSAWAVAARL